MWVAKTECIGNNLSQINFITIYFKSIIKIIYMHIYTYTYILYIYIYILYTVKQIIELIYRKKYISFQMAQWVLPLSFPVILPWFLLR